MGKTLIYKYANQKIIVLEHKKLRGYEKGGQKNMVYVVVGNNNIIEK